MSWITCSKTALIRALSGVSGMWGVSARIPIESTKSLSSTTLALWNVSPTCGSIQLTSSAQVSSGLFGLGSLGRALS